MDRQTTRPTPSPLSNLYTQESHPCFVDRLPTETLETIFLLYVRDYYGEDDGFPIPNAPIWINISYVSRHWRNVALNFPALWTYLFIVSPRWTEELLTRSKQAPLKVHVDLNWDTEHRGILFVEQIMNHLERIQELHLDLSIGNHHILSKLSSRAPHLECLIISTDCYPPGWSPELFNGDMPPLRILSLIYCPTPWYSLKLSGLTTLSLYSIHEPFQQNMAEFLTTLRCMQGLRHLYLSHALPSATSFLSSTTFNISQRITLSCLSHLLICAPLSTVVALLSYIDIPLKTEVRLDPIVEDHSSSLDLYALLCSLLAQRFRLFEMSSSHIIRSLIIISSDVGEANFTFNTSECDCDSFAFLLDMVWAPNIPLRINLSFLSPGFSFGQLATKTDRERIIAQICCSILLSDVQSLHFIHPPFSPAFWASVIGNLQSLRYLKLSDGYMPDLASILSVTHHHFPEDLNQLDKGQNLILAPALEKMELCDMSFSTAPESVDPLEIASVESLCDALSTRREPRGRLTMTRCTKLSFDHKTISFDMEGWWEGGQFHVVDEQEHRRL